MFSTLGKGSLKAFGKLTHVVDGQVRILSDPPMLMPIEEVAGAEYAHQMEGVLTNVLRSYRLSRRLTRFARRLDRLAAVSSRRLVLLPRPVHFPACRGLWLVEQQQRRHSDDRVGQWILLGGHDLGGSR